MITTYKYWFRFGIAPPEVLEKVRLLEATYDYTTSRRNSQRETLVSEMFRMHCKAATVRLERQYSTDNETWITPVLQIVYNLTGWDTRTICSWGGLFMFAFMLDNELPGTHKWHLEGGSEKFFK